MSENFVIFNPNRPFFHVEKNLEKFEKNIGKKLEPMKCNSPSN